MRWIRGRSAALLVLAAFVLSFAFIRMSARMIRADVLYLAVGDPARAAILHESPEGHALRFDREGSLSASRSSDPALGR